MGFLVGRARSIGRFVLNRAAVAASSDQKEAANGSRCLLKSLGQRQSCRRGDRGTARIRVGDVLGGAARCCRSPPSHEANVIAQLERKSPVLVGQISRPLARKLTLIAGSIALALIVGGAGWYLGHKNHRPSAMSREPKAERQVAMVPTGDESVTKQPEEIAVQPYGKAVKNPAVLPAEDVRIPRKRSRKSGQTKRMVQRMQRPWPGVEASG